MLSIALGVLATQLDIETAAYFANTVRTCNFSPEERNLCYCARTESYYNNVFQDIGDINCDNVFTRNQSYLLANAALSVACLILSVIVFITLIICMLECCLTMVRGRS